MIVLCLWSYHMVLHHLSKRSSIWAPQPRAYNVGPQSSNSSKAGKVRNDPISEGAEADEDFLPRQKAPLLMKIKE